MTTYGDFNLVFSLLGVVLIGRPAFLFGSMEAIPQGFPDVGPAQRLAGVGWAPFILRPAQPTIYLFPAGHVWSVCLETLEHVRIAIAISLLVVMTALMILYRYLHPRNREARSPNACNDILFIMVHHHIIFGVGRFIPAFYVSIHRGDRMVVFDIPVVYPTSWMWILLLLMVGIFGFAAQVRTLVIMRFLIGSLL